MPDQQAPASPTNSHLNAERWHIRLWRRTPGAFVPTKAYEAAQAFLATEAAGGLVLLFAATAALVWANSPVKGSYADLWDTRIAVDGGLFHIDEDLRGFVNEALMTLFFFVAGLEIKRELVHGELRTFRLARLPVIAALGGMAAPALIYLAFNPAGAASRGWAVPMATDIAFAVGMLTLLGRRIPLGVKVFLLALAIADDIGTITVIALLFSGSLDATSALLAVAFAAALVAAAATGLRSAGLYAFLGACLWTAMHGAGITPTLAGVLLGLIVSASPTYATESLAASARGLVTTFEEAMRQGDGDRQQYALNQLEELTRGSEAPLERLERAFHPWVSFGVVPLFALANLGVAVSGAVLDDALSSPVFEGVLAARLLGKLAGIFLATLLAVRLGLADLPRGASWRHIFGLGIVASVGFTVSILVADRAFTDQHLADYSKLALLGASIVAAVAGYVFLRLGPDSRGTGPD